MRYVKCARIAPAVALLLAVGSVHAVTTTWIGTNGNWSDPANWDNGVPIDNTFDVVIPIGKQVVFDLPAATVVRDFSLGSTSTLTFLGNRDLTVERDAAIGGHVNAENAVFTSTDVGGGSSAFTGNTAMLAALGGAQLTFDATSYNASGISSGYLLRANGSGSLLDVSEIQSINASRDVGGSPLRYISATDTGTIDLSSLLMVQGGTGGDRLVFEQTTGGSIDLSSLTNILSGNVTFDYDGDLTLPALENANSTIFDVPAGSTVSLPSLVSLTNSVLEAPDTGALNAPNLVTFDGSTLNLPGSAALTIPAFTSITNSRFNLSGGASYAVAATTYDVQGISSGIIASADGGVETGARAFLPTTLDLSSLAEIDASQDFGGSPIRTFTATAGGVIDLSGMTTVRGGHGGDRLEFLMDSGGTIDLSSLATVAEGNVQFTLNDATIYDFPALSTASSIYWIPAAGSTVNANTLGSQTGGQINVPASGIFNANGLATLNNTTVTIDSGGTFNALSLVDFDGSTLNLGADQVADVPGFSSITNARFHLTGGASYAVAATTYDVQGISSGIIASASGGSDDGARAFAPSTLDLSSVTEIDASQDFGGSPIRTFSAFDGGVIDLSGLTTVRGGHGGDRLEFRMDSGGVIDLSALAGIPEGAVQFSLNEPIAYAFPSLASAATVYWNPAAGATVEANSLATQLGGQINTPASGVFSLLGLTTLNNTVVSFDTDGLVDAPNLVNFDGSTLDLTADNWFNTGFINSITNSRFYISGGKQFGVDATTYDVQGISSGLIVSVEGFGEETPARAAVPSYLDMSTVTEIDASQDYGGSPTRTMQAVDQGILDLSGVTTLHGGISGDRLQFRAASGGLVDLTSLQSVASGNVLFNVEAEGTILVDTLAVTSGLEIRVADPSSVFSVAGSLLLDSGGKITAGGGSTLSIGQNFSHTLTAETSLQAMDAILSFPSPLVKAGLHNKTMEVAGLDEGLVDPSNSGNFGFGQLVVGSELGPAVTVTLLDVEDNGNRGGTAGVPEALYLFGLGGPSGLVINPGSTLVINNLNVYYFEDGIWKHLNALFGPGDSEIAFDNGFVVIPAPTTMIPVAFGVLGFMGRRRR